MMRMTGEQWIAPPPLQMSEWDAEKDEIEIEGIVYSGMLFRLWGTGEQALNVGALLRLVKRYPANKTFTIAIEHEPRNRFARAWAAFWRPG